MPITAHNLLTDTGQQQYLACLLKVLQIKQSNALAAFQSVYGVNPKPSA